jgi:cytochrome c
MRAGRILPAALVAVLGACGEATTPVTTWGDATRGRDLAAAYGCGACHEIPGIRRVAAIGPPLERWGQRKYIAGRLPNQPDALVRWIQDPRSVVPGTAMPDLGVSGVDARDIAAFLYSLD